MTRDPFWEQAYGCGDVFGPPSEEIVRLASELPAPSRVLDAGCGDGRNALCLAQAGHRVDAFDLSPAGVRALEDRCEREDVAVRTWTGDIRELEIADPYDLIVCHGVLHLLPRPDWELALANLRRLTRPAGVNVVCVFTDKVPCPPDLAPFTHGLFEEGELAAIYADADWRIEEARAYVFEDEHPGGIRHVHAANKVVAWKP